MGRQKFQKRGRKCEREQNLELSPSQRQNVQGMCQGLEVEGAMGRYCLMGMEFQFCSMKETLLMACTALYTH